MGDQACQTWLETLPEQPSSTIQRMKAGVNDVKGVTDVMQPSRSSEQFCVIANESAKAISLRSDGLHVLPPTRESHSQAFLRELNGSFS